MRPILVTGGAKGFGAQVCKTLASQGHEVVVHYRSSEKEADTVVQACGPGAKKIQGDFSTPRLLKAFIESYLQQFPNTKGIVNNVGNYLIAPPSKTTSEQWHELFQTNIFAPISLTQALLPALKKHKGSIVNIGTSGLLPMRALLNATAYAASKSALWFYTRSLAKELASDFVKVNMVSPGFLETAIDLDQAPQLPMSRPATLKEAADAVAFFFDEKNGYITGQNLEVAGGFNL